MSNRQRRQPGSERAALKHTPPSATKPRESGGDPIFAGLDNDLTDEPACAPVRDFRGQLTDVASVMRYVRAGKATLTLRSLKTGTRYTYRVTKSDDEQSLFVGVLTGQDNETSYSYAGRISRDVFWLGRKTPRPGDVPRDAPSAQAFDWAWRRLVRGEMPGQLEVWHDGRCGRCGHKLTVPESVAAGFGPECAGKVGT